MRNEIKNIIKQEILDGDTSTLDKIVDIMAPRLLQKVAPQLSNNEYNNVQVIKVVRQEGVTAHYHFYDPIEAMIQFHKLCNNEAVTVSHYEAVITQKAPDINDVKYDLRNAKLIQMKVMDAASVDGRPFEATINLRISGYILRNTQPKELEQYLKNAVTPVASFCEVIDEKTRFDKFNVQFI